MQTSFPRWCIAALLGLSLTLTARAASHPFLCCDYGGDKVAVVSADGKVEWEYPAKKPQDCWRMPNGDVLFCYVNGVMEVTTDKKIVWEYRAPEKTEVHACQPLADGRVLVVECGSSRLIEVDRAGKVAKEIKLETLPTIKLHNQFRGARKLANGHYLVTFKGEGKIKELDGEGKVLREIQVPGDPHEVVPLADGHLLIGCGDGHKVIELDAEAKVVWEINENDFPGNPLRLMAGVQRLPNGNTVIANWGGHGHLGQQPQIFEVTPDKKIVWTFLDYPRFVSINQFQMLDVPGNVVKYEVKR